MYFIARDILTVRERVLRIMVYGPIKQSINTQGNAIKMSLTIKRSIGELRLIHITYWLSELNNQSSDIMRNIFMILIENVYQL